MNFFSEELTRQPSLEVALTTTLATSCLLWLWTLTCDLDLWTCPM